VKFSLREIRRIFPIELRYFKLWKMPKLLNIRFPEGWYFLNFDNTELKRSSETNLCFRTASLSGSGLRTYLSRSGLEKLCQGKGARAVFGTSFPTRILQASAGLLEGFATILATRRSENLKIPPPKKQKKFAKYFLRLVKVSTLVTMALTEQVNIS